jgi:hypothetical protein
MNINRNHRLTIVATAESDSERRRASVHVYEAECALHAARQSQVDAWIAAASNKLHEAILEFDAVA